MIGSWSIMKTISLEQSVAMIPDGATVMIGGFMGVGTPERVVDEMVRQGKRDLTVIANDTATPDKGIGKLVSAKRLRKAIVSHIGLNPETQRQMMAGEMKVELVPQGTLIERIQAAGRGRGQELSGRTRAACGLRLGACFRGRLSRQPRLRADGAQLQPRDRHGGRHRHRVRRQHRAGRSHPAGSRRDARSGRRLPGRQRMRTPMEPQVIIARRIARELKDGMLVNLGIGIPTLVAHYVPDGVHVFFQSENGLIGTGASPAEGMAHPMLTDAGGRPVTALPGACAFDSAMSFGLIRGGHLDLTVLGGLQVDQSGRLANWVIPNKMVPGMGGAMDLICGAKRVIVAMQHNAKGKSKIVKKCTLPVTALRQVDLLVTELAVVGFPDGRATLLETAPGVAVADVVSATESELIVPDRVPEMIF
jgi:acetate CoA/acetoacetate CoA-transferase beta subunit